MTLWSDFMSHNGRVVSKWKHYFPAYQRHLARYVDCPLLLIEMGIDHGGSLQLWKRFFGPYARIVGIDIKEECMAYEEDQISVRIGSQSDERLLKSILEEFGKPDIVIDDGSHVASDQTNSFKFLYPRMGACGIYAIEDLHTSYWKDYGGGLHSDGGFMEEIKRLVDELHGHYIGPDMHTAFTDTTLSIHIYDSLAVLERGTLVNRVSPVRPAVPGRHGMKFEEGEFRPVPEGKS